MSKQKPSERIQQLAERRRNFFNPVPSQWDLTLATIQYLDEEAEKPDTQETEEEEPRCIHACTLCDREDEAKPQDEPKEVLTKKDIDAQLGELLDEPCHQESETKLDREIKKAEKALGNEKNLTQITFYEGYLKGLRFLKSLEK